MSALTVVPIEGIGSIVSIDAQCARLSLAWEHDPLCCAGGASIDARSKIVIARALPNLRWSPEGPILTDAAPSGVFERLAERADHVCIANESDPVFGEGCRIRALDPQLLPAGCALFPLDVIDGVLTPSPRIPSSALSEHREPMKTLWDWARPRFLALHGEAATAAVSAIADDFKRHQARHLHLKTLR